MIRADGAARVGDCAIGEAPMTPRSVTASDDEEPRRTMFFSMNGPAQVAGPSSIVG